MRFTETTVAGAWLVEPEARTDERGSFARLWCRDDFASRGLRADFVQCNSSTSRLRATLRGLHYQAAPFGEVKLISCTRGRVFDVIADMRSDSPTYLKWFGAELTAENKRMAYVPEGCAHGYLTLDDDSEVVYPVTTPYQPSAERGLRWNDPLVGIIWPIEPAVISPKDRAWPDFSRINGV